MNRLQRFFSLLLPKSWDLEAESRAWKTRCSKCDHESSIWETGGIRYKAVGNPRKMFRCPHCGKFTWHKLSYRPDGEKPQTA
jgi:hypothetical protein